MKVTEILAAEKWCPHAIASHTDPRAGFGPDDGRGKTHACIGSKCMAWRWFDPHKKACPQTEWYPESDDVSFLRRGEPPRPDLVPDHAVWVPITGDDDETCEGGYWAVDADKETAEAQAKIDVLRRGFCGLSGPPGGV